jgi:uncharacterized membrane protein
MNKLIENLLWVFIALVLIGALAAPFLWVYATVSECGWKGLFVQCRIEARPSK